MKQIFLLLSLVCIGIAANAQMPILAADINMADSSNPSYLTVMNGKLYFYANDGSHGREPYSYSETAGATIVADILPGSGSGCTGAASSNMAVLNNKLYFSAGTPSQLLYVYDGTNPASIAGAPFGNLFHPLSMTTVNGKLYFSADSAFNGSRLWAYDGVNAPTQFNIIDPGYTFTGFNGKVYFNSYYSDWNLTSLNPSTNGAAAITSASQSSGFTLPINILAMSTKLYFVAKDTAGYELYSYDGTTAARLTNLAVGANKTGALGPLAEYNGSIYFSGSTDGTNFQLYRYNAVSGAASLVSTINPSGNADIQSMIVYNGKLYFSAVRPSTGRELWTYDGTTGAMVADLNPGAADGMPLTGAFYDNSGLFAILNNHLYFSGNDGTHGNELFRLNTTTGVPDVKWSGEIKLYPNPTSTTATFEITLQKAQQLSVLLTDATGKTVFQTGIQSMKAERNTFELPVQNLPAGQYIYQVIGNDSRPLASGTVTKQ